MLGLNLAQWNDLTVVDHERLHDLLGRAQRASRARTSASIWPGGWLGKRASGPWCWATSRGSGDSLHLAARVYDVATGNRVDVARVDDRPGDDVRPLFDQLAAKLLDLSGAPNELPDRSRPLHHRSRSRRTAPTSPEWSSSTAGTWPGRSATCSRAVAHRHHVRPRVLQARAHPRLAGGHGRLDRGPRRSCARPPTPRNLPAHDRTVINAYRAFLGGEYADGAGDSTSSSSPGTRRTRTPGTAWARRGSTTPPGANQAPALTQAIRAFQRTLALDPDYALAYDHVQYHAGHAPPSAQPSYALVAAGLVRARLRRGRPGAGGQRDAPGARSAGPAPRRWPRRGAGSRASPPRSAPTARWWTPTSRRATTAPPWPRWIASGRLDPGASRAAVRRGAHPLRRRATWTAPRRSSAPRSTRWRRRTSGRTRARPRWWAISPPRPTCSPIRATSPTRPRRSTSPTRCAARWCSTRPASRRVHGTRTGAGWRWASCTRAIGRAGLVAPAGLAERRRGGADGDRRTQRKHLAHSGASAAIGLFTGPSGGQHAPWSSTARMTGEPLSPGGAGAAGAEPGRLRRRPAGAGGARLHDARECRSGRRLYTRPLAAQAYFLLGDYQRRSACCRTSSPRHSRPAGSIPAGACWAGSGCSAPRPTSSSAAAPRRGRSTARSWRQWKARRRQPSAVHPPGPAGAGAAGARGDRGRGKPATDVVAALGCTSCRRPFARSVIFPPLVERDGRGAAARPPRGKSELHRADCQVTPGRRKATDRATENRPPGGLATGG